MVKNSKMSLQEIIDVAKEDFRDEIMVAFLGDKFSGKTVHCALIKDTLANALKEYSEGEYIGMATDGSDRMNKIIDKLYNEEFPAKTPLLDADPITLEIISKSAGERIKIILRDMAGEMKEELLEKDMGVDERLEEIFKTARSDKPYGLLTHLIFAKIYIILIDCSEIDQWPSKQAYIKDTIRNLYEIKVKIGEVVNNRMHAPIAIVFSKYDTLAEEEKKSAKELMNMLKEVSAALEICHKGPLEYFISSVESVKISENELKKAVDKRIKEDDAEKNTVINNINDGKVRQAEARKNLDRARQILSALNGKLEEVRQTGDANQIDSVQKDVNRVQDVYHNAEIKYKDAVRKLDDARKKLDEINKSLEKKSNSDDLNISRYKPKKPLSYSRDDYLDLITWLIKMNKEIRGF